MSNWGTHGGYNSYMSNQPQLHSAGQQSVPTRDTSVPTSAINQSQNYTGMPTYQHTQMTGYQQSFPLQGQPFVAGIHGQQTGFPQQQMQQQQQQIQPPQQIQPQQIQQQHQMNSYQMPAYQQAQMTGYQQFQAPAAVPPMPAYQQQNSYQPAYQQPQQTGWGTSNFASTFGNMQSSFMPAQQAFSAATHQPQFSQHALTVAVPPHQQQAAAVSWKLSRDEKKNYDQIFKAWDATGSGFINADVAKEVFGQSGLGGGDLSLVWELADVDNRGKLTREEFHVAMGLIYRRLNGSDIPSTLPAELEPDSARGINDSVDFLKGLLKSEAGSPNSPHGSAPTRSFRREPELDDRQDLRKKDATVYRHNERDAKPAYISSVRHIDRSRVGDRSPAESMSEMRKELDRASKSISEEAIDDVDIEREISNVQREITSVIEDIDDISRRPRTSARDEQRRKLERQLLRLKHEDLPALEEKFRLSTSRQSDRERQSARERDYVVQDDRYAEERERSNRESESSRSRWNSERNEENRASTSPEQRRPPANIQPAKKWGPPASAPKPPPQAPRSPPMAPKRSVLNRQREPSPPPAAPEPARNTSSLMTSTRNPPPMNAEERKTFMQAEAQRRVQERLKALGVTSTSSSSPQGVDSTVNNRMQEDRKEAQERQRREDDERARLENEREMKLSKERNHKPPPPPPPAASATIKKFQPIPPAATKPASHNEFSSAKPTFPSSDEIEDEDHEIAARMAALEKSKADRIARAAELVASKERAEKELKAQQEREIQAEKDRLAKEKADAELKEAEERKARVLQAKKDRLEKIAKLEAEERAAEEAEKQSELQSKSNVNEEPRDNSHDQHNGRNVTSSVFKSSFETSHTGIGGNNPFRLPTVGKEDSTAPLSDSTLNSSSNPWTLPSESIHQENISSRFPEISSYPTTLPVHSKITPASQPVKNMHEESEEDWGKEKPDDDDDDDSSEDEGRNIRDRLAEHLFGGTSRSDTPVEPANKNSSTIAKQPFKMPDPSTSGPPPSMSSLLGAIQGGMKLRKAENVNDRSQSSSAGTVLGHAGIPPHIKQNDHDDNKTDQSLSSDDTFNKRQSVAWLGNSANQSASSMSTSTPKGKIFESVQEEQPEHSDQMDEIDFNCKLRFRTIYAYSSQRAEDCSFEDNQVLEVNPAKDPNSEWWFGKVLKTNEKGFFPKSYAVEINRSISARAIYAYDASSAEEASLSEHQILKIVDQELGDWWQCEMDDGTIKLVPSSYLEVI